MDAAITKDNNLSGFDYYFSVLRLILMEFNRIILIAVTYFFDNNIYFLAAPDLFGCYFLAAPDLFGCYFIWSHFFTFNPRIYSSLRFIRFGSCLWRLHFIYQLYSCLFAWFRAVLFLSLYLDLSFILLHLLLKLILLYGIIYSIFMSS